MTKFSFIISACLNVGDAIIFFRFNFVVAEGDVHTVTQIFHRLAKYRIIHQFIKVALPQLKQLELQLEMKKIETQTSLEVTSNKS